VQENRIFIGDSRDMSCIPDGSVDLVVTSPPYWHLKDYGSCDQIGYGQDLHSYLKDLFLVWRECSRIVRPGRRICINIGDQFTRSSTFGRYKVIPLHAETIAQLERLGMDFMGSIIWRKRTTMNTTGGAVVMGSYPYPPNGIVEIDYEHILIFKKPGRSARVDNHIKESSAMTKDQWKEYHLSHWTFAGARKTSHEAMFPPELPSRLIRMFTFKEETVLDPFLGSGTTIKAASMNGRYGIGFEIRRDYPRELIEQNEVPDLIEKVFENQKIPGWDPGYEPGIMNSPPPRREHDSTLLEKVESIDDDLSLILGGGMRVKLGGIVINDSDGARKYLEDFISGKQVSIEIEDTTGMAGIFLRNRIFVNGELVKRGIADVHDGDSRMLKRLRGIRERIRTGR
jgi:DNA modification methylase